MSGTTVLLIRHAEPAEEMRGRCYGSLDVALSGRGRSQASALAAAVRGVPLSAVYSSPRIRALHTALPIAQAAGLEPIEDSRLRELDFGELEGRTFDEIAATEPELYRRWMEEPTEVRFPGGESYADLAARAVGFLDATVARHAGEHIAVVSHGGVLRALLAYCLEIPAPRIFRIAQEHTAVSVVTWIEGVPLVRLVNAPAAMLDEVVGRR